MLGKSLISWLSKKQNSVATSTTEAEYMALSVSARQALWYIHRFQELGLGFTIPATLHCDNTASINISNNPIVSSRTKHIDIHYHYIRERLINKDFLLEYISTTSNLADIFTKPLDIGKQLGILQHLGCV
jgi:hypothetical protein